MGSTCLCYSRFAATTTVKSDESSAAIAAVSGLTKVRCVDWMVRLHEQFATYDWAINKGRGTDGHLRVLRPTVQRFSIAKPRNYLLRALKWCTKCHGFWSLLELRMGPKEVGFSSYGCAPFCQQSKGPVHYS